MAVSRKAHGPVICRGVFAVCASIYVVGALVGFDSYGAVCLAADRVAWHGEGPPLPPLFAASRDLHIYEHRTMHTQFFLGDEYDAS